MRQRMHVPGRQRAGGTERAAVRDGPMARCPAPWEPASPLPGKQRCQSPGAGRGQELRGARSPRKALVRHGLRLPEG